jgi:hypothetical protein
MRHSGYANLTNGYAQKLLKKPQNPKWGRGGRGKNGHGWTSYIEARLHFKRNNRN